MSFNFRSNPANPKRNANGLFGSNGEQKRMPKSRAQKLLRSGVYIHDIPIPVHLNPNLSQQSKIKHLKKKLLAGHHVTHSQINIVAQGDSHQRKRNKDRINELQMTDSEILHFPPIVKQPLYVSKGIVGIPSPHRPEPVNGVNSFGTPSELRVSMNGIDTQETHQRYRYFVDMTGFQDEEIHLALQGRRLLIVGERNQTKSHNAKSAAEVIRLPPGLEVDNLRAVRDCFGTVILEEAWKF